MLACTFLPFLSLIVDAHIRQLGDDDFTKREAAMSFLQKVLQDTDGYISKGIWYETDEPRNDGIRNYEILMMIKTARKNDNLEIRLRAKQLYDRNRERFLLEQNPPISIIFRTGDKREWKEEEGLSWLMKLIPEVLKRCEKETGWTSGPGYFGCGLPPKKLTTTDLRRIQELPQFVTFFSYSTNQQYVIDVLRSIEKGTSMPPRPRPR